MLEKNNFILKIIILSLLFILIPANAISEIPQELFNENITAEEKEKLENNEVIIRNLKNCKKLCFEGKDESAVKVRNEAVSLKPAYVAEIIQILPVKGNENLLNEMKQNIMDIKSYVGIPYYSVKRQKYFDLYSSAEIISTEKKENTTEVHADLYMEPFGTINTLINTNETSTSFYYQNTNLNELWYKNKFKCISPEKMKSLITIYRYKDYWILYGIGAVNAPSIFFLRERVETSFINRIYTFCSYFFKK